jgi:leader peptidase (prepilin peptidase)/N-methyltransferase
MSSLSGVRPAGGAPWAGGRAARYAALGLAALLAAALVVHHGLGARGLISAGVAVVLVALSIIDIEQHRLPNVIVVPATFVVLAAQIAFFPDRTLEWLLAAAGAALFLYVPMLVYPAGMGWGDVKLALLLGAAVGKAIALTFLVATVAAAVVSLAILAVLGAEGRKRAIPFGPFLALGTIVALFAGDPFDLI